MNGICSSSLPYLPCWLFAAVYLGCFHDFDLIFLFFLTNFSIIIIYEILKFSFSEKATKLMSNLHHSFDIKLVNVKTVRQIVAFSEKLNFMQNHCDSICIKSYVRNENRNKNKIEIYEKFVKIFSPTEDAKAYFLVHLRNGSNVVWSIIQKKTFLRQSAATNSLTAIDF